MSTGASVHVTIFLALVLAPTGCGTPDDHAAPLDTSTTQPAIPAGQPGWESSLPDEATLTVGLAASITADFIVKVEQATFLDVVRGATASERLARFDLTIASDSAEIVGEAMSMPTGTDSVRVYEGLGFEGSTRPSAFLNDIGYVLLRDGSEQLGEIANWEAGTSLRVQGAFRLSEDTGSVEFLGPAGELQTEDFVELFRLARLDGETEFEFLKALLAENSDYSEDSLGRIRTAVSAEQQRIQDPLYRWNNTPVETRSLEWGQTPPEILEQMVTAHVFIDIRGEFPEGWSVALQSSEGVVVGLLLNGTGSGFDVYSPHDSDWEIQLRGDGNSRQSIGTVPAALWTAAEATLIEGDAGNAEGRAITKAEFDRQLSESIVWVEPN